MKNKYLIRMEEPEDCLIVSDNGDIYYRMFLDPVTKLLKNEFDCMQFHKPSSKPIEYHEHDQGTETFFVTQGKFLCNCMGRGFVMGPGDILHIQPWMGHGFIPIEPESRLNILFMGIDQQVITQNWKRLQDNYPGVYEDLAFKRRFREFSGSITNRTLPVPSDFPPGQVQQLRPAGTCLREHEFEGIKLHLKVARYETEGVKEIWELHMNPGFFCQWDDFIPEYRLFYVTSGKVRCSVKTSSTETLEFDAVGENIISIPPYTPFGFVAIEETRMYDLDCAARLQDFCEEAESLRHNDPGKSQDKAAIMPLCKEYGLNCTDFGCT